MYVRLHNGKKIYGQDRLKQLGFFFGRKPTIDVQIEEMSLKFRKRLWYIRHLKAAGLPSEDLIAMYKCFLLSVLDYASVVYGPMISGEQAQQLERLQATALKIIFGLKHSYRELLEVSGLEPLVERRQRLIDKFILKAVKNDNITEAWFPTKTFIHHNLRHEKIFEEKFARTERLYRSPLYTYRRRLNEIYVHELNKEDRRNNVAP